MKRLERSRSRSHSEIRKHTRKFHKLENFIESSSQSDEDLDKSIDSKHLIKRNNILYLKKNMFKCIMKKKKIILNQVQEKFLNYFSVPYSSLREWIKEYNYIENKINKKIDIDLKVQEEYLKH